MKEPKASPKDWIAKGEANMNESEVLFCALLLIKSTEKVPRGRDDLSKWSSAVLCEEKHATELQAAWTPPEDKRILTDFFGPLAYVFKKCQWPLHELDAVGLAMQAWRRAGHFNGLTGKLLHNYIIRTPLTVRTSSKTAPPARWRSWAVVRIARLLYESHSALRKLLKLDVENPLA